ncbi:MAG TPA: LysR family transcriptional regulator [Candidatus Koribacter sp.]|jgi:LysR family transcriptional activator of nhaA
MPHLNYHHLLYFFTVAKTGSIARAAVELELTQPTISEQIRLLEKSLGHKLFDRVGRSLILTDTGRTVFKQAERIFLLGDELTRPLNSAPAAKVLRVAVDPAISSALVALALRREKSAFEVHYFSPSANSPFDIILTGTRPPHRNPKPILDLPTVFLSKSAAKLSSQPFLMPTSAPQDDINRYFRAQKMKPAIAGRFPSTDLILELARQGRGACAAPDFKGAYPVLKILARTNTIRWRIYAQRP